MATRSYTSRRELEQHSFSPAVALLVPLTAILLQALLPKPFPGLAILDLPLIVTIFFAVSGEMTVSPRQITLASLCSRAFTAICSVKTCAARTPGTLFAVMLMPVPVVQTSTPSPAFFAATLSATA